MEAFSAREPRLQVIHGDLHPHNLLLGNNGETVIVDFGNVSYADFLTDVGFALHRLGRQAVVFHEKPWQETLEKAIHAFLGAYRMENPLEEHEIALVPAHIDDLLLRKVELNLGLYCAGKRSWEDALKQHTRFTAFGETQAIKSVL